MATPPETGFLARSYKLGPALLTTESSFITRAPRGLIEENCPPGTSLSVHSGRALKSRPANTEWVPPFLAMVPSRSHTIAFGQSNALNKQQQSTAPSANKTQHNRNFTPHVTSRDCKRHLQKWRRDRNDQSAQEGHACQAWQSLEACGRAVSQE